MLLQRDGWAVNRKRVLRLMREDNLLCLLCLLCPLCLLCLLCLPGRRFVPATTDSFYHWPLFANLAGTLRPGAVNRLRVADITPGQARGRPYVRLQEAFICLAVLLDAFSQGDRLVSGGALERTALDRRPHF